MAHISLDKEIILNINQQVHIESATKNSYLAIFKMIALYFILQKMTDLAFTGHLFLLTVTIKYNLYNRYASKIYHNYLHSYPV